MGTGVVPGIEDRGLQARVGANQQHNVCSLKAQNSGVQQVVGANVAVQIWEPSLTGQVATTQAVDEILHKTPQSQPA